MSVKPLSRSNRHLSSTKSWSPITRDDNCKVTSASKHVCTRSTTSKAIAQGGRLTPRLIGFLTEPERQFFDLFCSVDGVGVKKALRAMVRPVKELAVLIEEQDAKGLSALPGIGPATSERVIAKLRRKMPRFALMVDRDAVGEAVDGGSQVVSETFDALVTLGHSESDARKLIDDAIASGKKFKDTESLLTAIYQRSQ